MFGPKLSTVFTSRWRALWFAASMVLFAYCSVPAPEDGDHPAKQHHHHTNPWALKKHQ